jgi:hypothetical protein
MAETRMPTDEDLVAVLEAVYAGRSANSACIEFGLHNPTVYTKLNSEAWRENYASARACRADFHAEQALQICLAAAMKRKIEGQLIEPAGAHVALDGIKWAVGRMDPKGGEVKQVQVGVDLTKLSAEELEQRQDDALAALSPEALARLAQKIAELSGVAVDDESPG